MSQSYLIFSEDGRKLEIEGAYVENITVSHDGEQETLGAKPGNEVKKYIGLWKGGEISALKFTGPDAKDLFDEIKRVHDRYIVAAGGLVCNDEGKLLIIFRKGKWDLPKGKIEAGEKTDEAAVREVIEETGLKKVEIETEFKRTYHIYYLKGRSVLKETVWYLMNTNDTGTTPQQSEGITSVDWVSAENLEEISKNTFENILLLLKTFFKVAS